MPESSQLALFLAAALLLAATPGPGIFYVAARAPTGRLTWLSRLRNAPQSPAPGNVGKLLDCLGQVREPGLDRSRASALPAAAFERLADEAARLAVQHLFAGGRGEAVADVDARHGNEPGASFHTHISERHDHAWNAPDQPGPGEQRPLRSKAPLLAA